MQVRYRTGDGHTASISGFTSQRAADNYTAEIVLGRPALTHLEFITSITGEPLPDELGYRSSDRLSDMRSAWLAG